MLVVVDIPMIVQVYKIVLQAWQIDNNRQDGNSEGSYPYYFSGIKGSQHHQEAGNYAFSLNYSGTSSIVPFLFSEEVL
jgi:hypothetical protein